jgi:hypothetical protein
MELQGRDCLIGEIQGQIAHRAQQGKEMREKIIQEVKSVENDFSDKLVSLQNTTDQISRKINSMDNKNQ